MKRPISVCICGGGNAAHVLAADLGARPKDFVVSLFAGFADEAEKVGSLSMRTIITLHCLNAVLVPLARHSRCSCALGSPLALFSCPWLATRAVLVPLARHSRCSCAPGSPLALFSCPWLATRAVCMPLARHSRCSHALGSPLALFACPWLATRAVCMPLARHSRCYDAIWHITYTVTPLTLLRHPLAHHSRCYEPFGTPLMLLFMTPLAHPCLRIHTDVRALVARSNAAR
jgi:hypothetical protein